MTKLATLTFLLAACPIATHTLTAQGNYISYPNDTVTETGRATQTPFSFDATSGADDEGRYQCLIPATHLPTEPTNFQGIGYIPHGHGGSIGFEHLHIRVVHTTATSLGGNLDTNIAGASLVTPGPEPFRYTTTMTDGDWSLIFFPVPFSYNGTDNVIIDIQARYDRINDPIPGGVALQTSSNPARTDLPIAFGTSGAHGSGAASATSPTIAYVEPVKLRLLSGFSPVPVPTLSLRGDTGGLSGNTFAVGSQFVFKLDLFPAPGRSFAVMGDLGGFLPPYTLPGFLGQGRVNPSLVFASGIDTMAPGEEISFQIPPDNGLVGLHVVFQALTLNTLADIGFTNACDMYVNAN